MKYIKFKKQKVSIKDSMKIGRWALNNFSSDTTSHVTVEGSFLSSEIEDLRAKGHDVTQIKDDFDKAYGPVSAIYKDSKNEWNFREEIPP